MKELLLAILLGLPAFPGATGFGANSVGGSGRHLNPPQTAIYKVTSLADSGPGTLRGCIDANMPRTCIFEVGGIIPLVSNLRVTNPYITIAGQTAPVPGILIRNGELGVVTHDVVVQHLHIRAGGEAGSDPGSRGTVGFYGDNGGNSDQTKTSSLSGGTFNVIVDHCSLSWSIDENVDTWYSGVHDITLSNSILAESLYSSIHPMGPQGTAIIVGEGAHRLSFVRNLIAHNFSRNPYYKTDNSSEFVNNIVYHWGFGTGGNSGSWAMTDLSNYDHVDKPSFHNFIGNVYKCGTDSECNFSPIFSSSGADAFPLGGRIYVKNNVGPGRPTNGGDEWAIVNGLPKATYCTATPAVPGSVVVDMAPQEAYDYVLRESGALPEYRDVVDVRVVNSVKAGTGGFVDCVQGCDRSAGGWPNYPEQHVTHVPPANPMRVEADGYTALEHWIWDFPKPPIPTPTAAPTPSYSPCP